MKRVGQVYRERLIKEVQKNIKGSDTTFFLTYTKLSGAQMNDLRRDLGKAGAKVFVTKNSFARIALKELKKEELGGRLSGQTACIYGAPDAVEVSKVLVKFIKASENIILRLGILGERVLEKEDVKRLSELPAKEVLYSILLGTIASPVTRLLGAMNSKQRDLLSILKQLSEKKGGN